MDSRRMALTLWCVLLVFTQMVHARSSNSTTTAPTSTTETPSLTTATPSASGSYSESTKATEIPVGTVAPATPATPSVDTAYICSGDEVARLTKLNENNPYLLSQCTKSAGITSYVFPFNGVLSYAQMVAMGSVGECGYYFRAVLLVQLQECIDANVYIRTTAEAILQLAATSGDAPTEADVNAAIAVRKAYNLALRDGGGSATYSDTSGASALSWNIEGDSIDTTASANTTGQLLLSTDLHVIGTYYASADSSASTSTSKVEDARNPGQSTTDSSAAVRRETSPWLVALAVACTALMLHSSS